MYISLKAEQTTVGMYIFHKYCRCIKYGGIIKQNWLYEILGGRLLICQIASARVWGAWIRIRFMFKNIQDTWWPVLDPAGSCRAARGARICATRLLIIISYIVISKLKHFYHCVQISFGSHKCIGPIYFITTDRFHLLGQLRKWHCVILTSTSNEAKLS